MELVEELKIIQAVLLKQLPAERINGFINIIYAMRPSATEQEIESALVRVGHFHTCAKTIITFATCRIIFMVSKGKHRLFGFRM